MAIDFTPSQKNAINSKDGDILVSAAAGSGKTAVLSERLALSLCDTQNRTDLSEVLVVTFTRAAASSLKQKIAEKLKEKIKEYKNDSKIVAELTNQLLSVNSAAISTIHSFCYDLIGRNFKELSLPASMKIGDDTEMKALLEACCETCIDRWYEEHTREFSALCDIMVSVRDNMLSKKLLEMYDELRGYVDGIDVLVDKTFQKAHRDEALKVAKNIICASFERFFDHFENVYENAVEATLTDEKVNKARYGVYSYELEFIKARKASVVFGDIGTYVEYFQKFQKQRAPNLSQKSDEIAMFDSFRKDFKDRIDSFINTYTVKVDTENAENVDEINCHAMTLHGFMSDLDAEYARVKKEKGLLDYTDLERLSLKLLKNPAIAAEVRSKYKRIYIDEYQDVSPLQDEIFKRISKNNRFMVGDIKQSIYKFRGAAPDLFAGYRDRFPDHVPENPSENARIFLSENFRCDKNIIKFSNMIFGNIFNKNSGRVSYLEKDALVFAKKNPEDHIDTPVKLCLITTPKDEELEYEAKWVASEIKKLMDAGEEGKNICIMLRSPKKTAKVFKNELSSLGINSGGGVKVSFFEYPEISLSLAILNCIDNPSRDIWLAAALKSPVFGITADELYKISAEKKGSLYKSLVSYAKESNSEKCSSFLETLKKLRSLAVSEPACVLLRTLYDEVGVRFAALGDPATAARSEESLEKLYRMARNFENGTFKGVHAFIKYVETMMNDDSDEGSENEEYPDDYVRIMSVHHSKGLEYPVCFLCNTKKRPNLLDQSGDILIDSQLGVGMRLKDQTGFLKFDTLTRRALSIRGNDDAMDEEMRALYVALTRAKNTLYVTAAGEKVVEDADLLMLKSEFSSPQTCMSASASYFTWIMSSLKKNDPCYEIIDCNMTDPEEKGANGAENGKKTPEKVELSPEEREAADTVLKNLEFVKYLELKKKSAAIPAKMSVSTLTPDILDEGDFKGNLVTNSVFEDSPAFMKSDAKLVSGAKRGIATHTFMQFASFENVDKYGVGIELARLVSAGFMDRHTADLVNWEKVEKFFASDLYKTLKGAKKLYREKRFNVMLPAERFTNDPQRAEFFKNTQSKVLVQGVMDCMFELADETLCVLDYKTDSVPLDHAEAAKMLAERYKTQLEYYSAACEIITGKRVSKKIIWSFALGMAIEL